MITTQEQARRNLVCFRFDAFFDADKRVISLDEIWRFFLFVFVAAIQFEPSLTGEYL